MPDDPMITQTRARIDFFKNADGSPVMLIRTKDTTGAINAIMLQGENLESLYLHLRDLMEGKGNGPAMIQ